MTDNIPLSPSRKRTANTVPLKQREGLTAELSSLPGPVPVSPPTAEAPVVKGSLGCRQEKLLKQAPPAPQAGPSWSLTSALLRTSGQANDWGHNRKPVVVESAMEMLTTLPEPTVCAVAPRAGLEQQPGLPVPVSEPWEALGFMAQTPKLSAAPPSQERGSAGRRQKCCHVATETQTAGIWVSPPGDSDWGPLEWEAGFHNIPASQSLLQGREPRAQCQSGPSSASFWSASLPWAHRPPRQVPGLWPVGPGPGQPSDSAHAGLVGRLG